MNKQTAFDIFVTACEGGINYWSNIRKYHVWKNPKAENLEEDLDGFSAEVMDIEDYEVDHGPMILNYDVIVKGTQIIESGDVSVSDEIYQQAIYLLNDKDCDFDATTADCIVQAGLFGEVKYG